LSSMIFRPVGSGSYSAPKVTGIRSFVESKSPGTVKIPARGLAGCFAGGRPARADEL
jgi:hypothetical protein